MNALRHSATAAVGVLALLGSATAQLQVTLAPLKDNTIYRGDPGASNGAGTRFFCGNDLASTSRRGLIAFDVAAAIPAGSTITAARLELTVAQTLSLDKAVDVHRVLVTWGEAGSIALGGQGGGAPAQPGDATWNDRFFGGGTWSNPGGDFDPTPSATKVVGSFGTFAWSSPQLAGDVQGWLDNPSQAFGWLLVTDENNLQTARAFHTREATVVANRPRLVIDYIPGAEVQVFGTGCTGGGPNPLTLGTVGLPTVPNPTFAFTLSGGPTTALRAIDYFAGLLPGPIPIGGGCSLWGNFALFVDGVLTTGTTPLAIPNDPSLYGVQFAAQGLAVDTTTNALATSNGLLLRLGQ